ncbi:hypothetical protein, partial [Sicyoidochytrium minutum DNA virus]
VFSEQVGGRQGSSAAAMVRKKAAALTWR